MRLGVFTSITSCWDSEFIIQVGGTGSFSCNEYRGEMSTFGSVMWSTVFIVQ